MTRLLLLILALPAAAIDVVIGAAKIKVEKVPGGSGFISRIGEETRWLAQKVQSAGGLFLLLITALPAAAAPVPALHSRPSAPVTLFLDFDGDNTPSWESYSPGVTPPYDQPASIREVWGRVAEKFAPFNLDVTTVDPGNLTHGQTCRVVIGGTGAWTGGGLGGISYTSGFLNTTLPNTAFVFPPAVGNDVRNVAEAAAHEAGHLFGLQHQSVYAGGVLTGEYNYGNSLTAPIMGASYNAARGIWWNGTSIGPTTIQDDLTGLSRPANGFGYRADDDAGVLPLAASQSGVIETTADRDAFSFTSVGGAVTLTATPGSYFTGGGTLDLTLAVSDAATGRQIALADTAALGETLTLSLPAGAYLATVGSHGSYGDVGTYTVTVAPVGEPGTALLMCGLVMVGCGRRRISAVAVVSRGIAAVEAKCSTARRARLSFIGNHREAASVTRNCGVVSRFGHGRGGDGGVWAEASTRTRCDDRSPVVGGRVARQDDDRPAINVPTAIPCLKPVRTVGQSSGKRDPSRSAVVIKRVADKVHVAGCVGQNPHGNSFGFRGAEAHKLGSRHRCGGTDNELSSGDHGRDCSTFLSQRSSRQGASPRFPFVRPLVAPLAQPRPMPLARRTAVAPVATVGPTSAGEQPREQLP